MSEDVFHEKAINALFADTLSADRFLTWKLRDPAAYAFLNGYALGEIFWKKSLGRPSTPLLRDGFTITATHEIWLLVPISEGGPLTWERFNLPLAASWWDGKDDDVYHHVPFLIGQIPSGKTNDQLPEHYLYTHITPTLNKGVRWVGADGKPVTARFGFRAIEPASADFVMQTNTVVLSFEVVLKLPLVFNEDGVIRVP